MSSKKRKNKRKPPTPQNKSIIAIPKLLSPQFKQLSKLVHERFEKDPYTSYQYISYRASRYDVSIEEYMSLSTLFMLYVKKSFSHLSLRKSEVEDYFELEKSNFEAYFDNLLKKPDMQLFSDIQTIEDLLKDKQLIELLFEYIFDPIKIDRRIQNYIVEERGGYITRED